MQQVVTPHPSFDIVRTAMDSLTLPLRRPVLFVPFLFTLVLLFVLVFAVFLGTFIHSPGPARVTAQQIIALTGAVALIVLASVLAVEATADLTARAELGRDLDLAEAVAHAMRRLPVTLATTAVITVGIVVGTMLLIIPGLVVGARWFLSPTAALLSGRGVREAIGLSWQMTGAHLLPLAGPVLVVGVGTAILSIPLSFLPVFGQLAAAWLGFAWGAVALAMAYVRLGGPVELG